MNLWSLLKFHPTIQSMPVIESMTMLLPVVEAVGGRSDGFDSLVEVFVELSTLHNNTPLADSERTKLATSSP
jgi:hypothetical protein